MSSSINAIILLIILIIFVMSMGCIIHYRQPVSEFAKNQTEKFGNIKNYYTMLENEYTKFKAEDQIGLPGGVLRLKKNIKIDGIEQECNPEGTSAQLIQSNVTFEPTRMEYVNGHPECTEVERVWPGQLY
jgi:hypothetical protein